MEGRGTHIHNTLKTSVILGHLAAWIEKGVGRELLVAFLESP